MKAEKGFVLCQADGRIVASDAAWRQQCAADYTELDVAATQLACPRLFEAFRQFSATEGTDAATVPLPLGGRIYQLQLRRLGAWILLELAATPEPAEGEQARLAHIGRLTARLIHDVRNQLGGLKLYATYLKKALAGAATDEARAECAAVADKIIAGLNTMAEHATQVGNLAQASGLRNETPSPNETREAG